MEEGLQCYFSPFPQNHTCEKVVKYGIKGRVGISMASLWYLIYLYLLFTLVYSLNLSEVILLLIIIVL